MDRPVAQQSMVAGSLYLPTLDGLRFLAFLLVFVHHFDFQGTYLVLDALSARGWVGVDIFFSISAYLLYSLLMLEYKARGTVSLPSFYARRFLRIYPLMLFFPIAMLLIFGVTGPTWSQRLVGIGVGMDNFLSWIGGYNFAIPYSAHLWTLSYELQLYAILPFAFLAFRGLDLRTTLAVLLAIELVALAARWAFATSGAAHPIIWVTPFLRPESTLAGIAIAVARPRISPLLCASVLVAATALLLAGPNIDKMGNWTVVIYLLVGAISGSILLLALQSPWLIRILSRKEIRYLGKISFGLYVYHALAIHLTVDFIAPRFENLSLAAWLVVFLPVALGLTIALGAVSYQCLERPFLRLKDRIAIIHSRPI